MTPETDELKPPLESQAFYELMQRYRHWPIEDSAGVVRAFEEVKAYIRTLIHPVTDGHGNDITGLVRGRED